MARQGKPIERSDGVRYDSIKDAVDDLQSSTYHTLIQGNAISRAARGVLRSAYGYEWKFLEHKGVKDAIIMSRKADFMLKGFDNMLEAVEWVRENGYPNAHHVPILRCAKGHQPLAYGATWAFDEYEYEQKPKVEMGRPTKWPFAKMEVGETVEFEGADSFRAQKYCHVYGRQKGMKFKTKRNGLIMTVERIA